MSAAVSVTGHYVIKNQDVGPVWVTDAVTPIDGNGNSLAGQSEASLESFYEAYDATIMSTSRSSPMIIQEPSDYAGSFINSDESEVVPGIGAALITLGINPAVYKLNTVITVTFDDGTTAQYIKVSMTGTYQWAWNGTAHDKAGNKIKRDGSVIRSTASAGGGGGSFDVRGFGTGTGGGINWDWAGDGLRGVVTITPADGPGSPVGGGTGAVYQSYY